MMGAAQATLRSHAGRTTLAYYFAFVALGLATAAVGPTLPGLAGQTSSTLAAISIIFSTQSGGYVLGSLVGGQLYDRLPGHPVMAAALVAIALLMASIPFIETVWLLAVVFFAIGLFLGALDVGGNALIGWLHGPRVGPYMNGLHFFFGVGAFAAPLVVAAALGMSDRTIAWAYWSLALLMLPAALLPLTAASPRSAFATRAQASASTPWLLVGLIVAFYFLYVGAEHTFGGWVFTYATAPSGAQGDAISAAYLNSAFWGSFTLGRLVSIPLARRLRPRTIMLADLIAAAGSLGVIMAWPQSLTALWIGVIGFGFSLASVFPTMLTWAGRRINLTGSITGFFFVGGSAGAMFFPWLTGQFFERTGPASAIWIVLLAVAGTLALFFVVMGAGGRPKPPTRAPNNPPQSPAITP